MVCCDGCPRRYLVVFLGCVGLILSIGLRTCFSVVVVQVTTPPAERHCGANETFYMNVSRRDSNFMFTAYFVGSFVTQFPGGVMALRFRPTLVCGISILVTSLLFIVLPFVMQYQYPLVFVVRALQGLVEGLSVPSLNGVIAAWAPSSEKARMVGLVYAGAYLSPAVALILTGNVFLCLVSWNSVFFFYGGAGILWFLLWTILVKDTPAMHTGLGTRERALFDAQGARVRAGNMEVFRSAPWRRIFASVPLWATFVGAFCRNWIFSLLLTQQPQYFQDVFNYKIDKNTALSSVPHLIMTVVVLSGGFVFDQLIKAGLSTTVVRKLAQTMGFGVEAACIMGMAFTQDKWVAFSLLSVGVGLSGLAISGYQVNPLDLSPQFATVLTGIVRMGVIGAIGSTIVAAYVTDQGHSYEEWRDVLIVAASVHIGGVIFFLIFASGARLPWDPAHELIVAPPEDEADGERRSLLGDDVSINSALDGGRELEWSGRFLDSMG